MAINILMNTEIINRKGARKAQDIPEEVLDMLNTGVIESVNLTEWLAIDHLKLLKNQLPKIGVSEQQIDLICQKIKAQKKPSTMQTIKLVGTTLYQSCPDKKERRGLFDQLCSLSSDSMRCYAPYLIALNDHLSMEEKFRQCKPLIADKHFGVREVVWMALRPGIAGDLERSIEVLSRLANHKDENIRRFTTEATRPRGVWCKHIEQLKENPEIALPILENLKSDTSEYVQNSVGNWLNDASKSKPDFVIDLCDKWQRESPTKETARIVKRARRTIDKA